jgi:hypothetical protein
MGSASGMMGLTLANYFLLGGFLATAYAIWILVTGRISSGQGIYTRTENPMWYWIYVGLISVLALGMWIGAIWPTFWLQP